MLLQNLVYCPVKCAKIVYHISYHTAEFYKDKQRDDETQEVV